MINTGLKIVSAWFVETGTSPDMVSRNFTTHLDQQAVNMFANTTQGVSQMNMNNLAGVAGRIIQLDANNERYVQIPNGWRQKRYRFVLRVTNPANKLSSTFFYTGYTDFNGWSPNAGEFDQNMAIYINNVVEVNQQTRFTNGGATPFVSVVECNHLIHPRALGSPQLIQPAMNLASPFQAQQQNNPSMLRPVDLLVNLDSRGRAQREHQTFGTDFIETRTNVDLAKSSRMNAVPSHYLSTTANALIYGANEAAATPQTELLGHNNTYSIAAGVAQERGPYSDRFLNRLMTEYGYHVNGFITWGDLRRAHPELMMDGVTHVFNSGEAKKRDIYVSDHTQMSSFVNDRSPETLFVSQVMQSIPGLLLESLLAVATIKVTNMTTDGQIFLSITNPISFVDLPPGYLASVIPHLEQRLRHIIFRDVVQNNYVAFDATFTLDVFGESFVLMSYNGEPHRPYSIPTYCDSMFTAMVSDSSSTLMQMSSDLNYLVQQTCSI